MNRNFRWWVQAIVALLVVSLGAGPTWSKRPPRTDSTPSTDPAAAIAELENGNRRFVVSARTKSIDTSHDAAMRRKLGHGQHPIAAIVCCSDSRVCPEFIFDQTPGSFFEIRNAGNVVDEDVMASVEYAVEHLHVQLVIVMGHSKCGAIKAVHDADGRPLHKHLDAIQSHMHGLDREIHRFHDDHSQATLDRLSNENAVQQTTILLDECPLVKQAVQNGSVRVLTMTYNIDSGAAKSLKTWAAKNP